MPFWKKCYLPFSVKTSLRRKHVWTHMSLLRYFQSHINTCLIMMMLTIVGRGCLRILIATQSRWKRTPEGQIVAVILVTWGATCSGALGYLQLNYCHYLPDAITNFQISGKAYCVRLPYFSSGAPPPTPWELAKNDKIALVFSKIFLKVLSDHLCRWYNWITTTIHPMLRGHQTLTPSPG